jgi:hypothetical protein
MQPNDLVNSNGVHGFFNVRDFEFVLGCINVSYTRYTGQNREYRVIRDKAFQGVNIRDKTCSAVKRVQM